MNFPLFLLREPLVQFLLIGTVAATVYAFVPRNDAATTRAAAQEIVVTEGQVAQLRQLFERTWRRPPSAEEAAGLIDSHIREEVLYRAGRDLGLDEDDTIVRRRVGQKMEFLMEPGPNEIDPTDADLAAHLAANPERYREPAEIAFRQIFVEPARHPDRFDEVIASLQEQLAAGRDPADLGDPTLLPEFVGPGPIGNVERVFGGGFAEELLALPTGRWVGPIGSPFGRHLVRIEQRVSARDPSLDEARDAVRRDVVELRRRQILEERLAELRARYRVVMPRGAAPDRLSPDNLARRQEAE